MSGECAVCGKVYGVDAGFGNYHSIHVDRSLPSERYYGLCDEHYNQLIDFLRPKQTAKEKER